MKRYLATFVVPCNERGEFIEDLFVDEVRQTAEAAFRRFAGFLRPKAPWWTPHG